MVSLEDGIDYKDYFENGGMQVKVVGLDSGHQLIRDQDEKVAEHIESMVEDPLGILSGASTVDQNQLILDNEVVEEKDGYVSGFSEDRDVTEGAHLA